MDDADVLPYIQDRIPGFAAVGTPERLPEGNLNKVWRVTGADRSVIVKHAPPYVASNPDIPLDPSRLVTEARCLEAFGPEGPLRFLTDDRVRPPRLLDANRREAVLIMEDVGDWLTLDRWLSDAEDPSEVSAASSWGHRLGRFIGRLHAVTANDSFYAEEFDNRPMQETRLAVQYQGVADMLRAGGVDDAEVLGSRAEALGESLLEPGRCLTMGDLWPPSVLVVHDGLRLIDWELGHYGRPLQDVAHWRAHLWMQRHRAPSVAVARAVEALRDAFLGTYIDVLGSAQASLWDDAERRDAAVHFGAEILVRAVGPFQDGYVYAGLPPDHSAVQEAVTTAARHLRAPQAVDVFPPHLEE